MTEITLSELAEKSGGNYDTLYRKAKRNFPEISWTKDSPVSADQIRLLSGKKRKRQTIAKPIVVNQPEPAAEPVPPARQKIEWPTVSEIRTAAINILLFGAVIVHAGLIWYDCSELWDVAGQIGGGAVFMVVLAALLLASDSNLPRTSGNAMAFIFFVDCAAWKVHYEVFKTPLVDNVITGALCAFICASSFVALWVFRDSKLD